MPDALVFLSYGVCLPQRLLCLVAKFTNLDIFMSCSGWRWPSLVDVSIVRIYPWWPKHIFCSPSEGKDKDNFRNYHLPVRRESRMGSALGLLWPLFRQTWVEKYVHHARADYNQAIIFFVIPYIILQSNLIRSQILLHRILGTECHSV